MRLSARALALVVIVGAASAAPTAHAAGAPGVGDAVRYLASRQASNGAFFSEEATPDVVAEATAAVAAAGGAPAVVERAMSFVAANGPARAKDRGGHAARIILGIVATGDDPRSFRGTDYVAALRAHHNAVTGTYDTGVYANALAVLGAASVGISPSDATRDYFRLAACSNGGMAHEAGCVQRPDIDTTAMAIIALRAGGVAATDPVVSGARRFLIEARNADGGWGLEMGKPTNANSTGLAISAVLALGERPSRAPWRAASTDPVAALRALQLPSGAFSYLAGQPANDYATVQALPALAGLTYPLRQARPGTATADVTPAVDDAPRHRTRSVSQPLAQAGTPEPTPTVDARESREARVEESLGDRETGSGSRVFVLYLSMVIALIVIFGPVWWRKRRRATP